MNTVKMTLGVSLVLSEMVEKLLFTVKEIDGKKMVVDRELPFRLRYRLNRNRQLLEKDAQYFDKQRLILMAKYGEPTEDGMNVIIKEDKQEEYKKAISDLIDSGVEHDIMVLEPEDLTAINDTDINVSPDAMTIFISYMTNDPSLQTELNSSVNLIPHAKPSEPVEEKKIITTTKKTRKKKKETTEND